MTISLFELFKIGIGPSSSHTVGPMRAARRYLLELKGVGAFEQITRIQVELYGSLALTGSGHGTDKALLLGLEGYQPALVEPDQIDSILQKIRQKNKIVLLQEKEIAFQESKDFLFLKGKRFPYHSNGMRFIVYDSLEKEIDRKVFYSVGGGFVVDQQSAEQDRLEKEEKQVPFPYSTFEELTTLCEKHGKSIDEIIWENEKVWKSQEEVEAGVLHIWDVMQECIDKGCHTEGILPGGLNVVRRAPQLYQDLAKREREGKTDPGDIMDWVSTWALATNEENAAGGRVVTAPTNGAAGVIPSVLQYYVKMYPEASREGILKFFAVAAAIGILYTEGASISAAEMGCQGEIGVACSMAAGALASAMGGSIDQIENAAEIGMEHHLGLTCDPVKGLVQIPCIERNTMGAIKAINAARLALKGDGSHRVTLDQVIATMFQTGKDMQTIYKETSEGGLAVNVPEC